MYFFFVLYEWWGLNFLMVNMVLFLVCFINCIELFVLVFNIFLSFLYLEVRLWLLLNGIWLFFGVLILDWIEVVGDEVCLILLFGFSLKNFFRFVMELFWLWIMLLLLLRCLFLDILGRFRVDELGEVFLFFFLVNMKWDLICFGVWCLFVV